MAARYAVSTGNWTGAIWAATAGGAAGSAAVPTAADDVTINKNVVVTLDATTCVALTVALSVGTTGADVGGKLTPSLAANSKLTVEQGISSPGASGGSGSYATYFAFDVSSAPTYICEIVLNNVNATGAGYGLTMGGNWNLVGAVKKRHTTITGAISAGATSATVADATGWAVGDKIIFATTSAYSATPATDEVTLTSVNTGTGAIGWTGGTTYAHASGCPAGNFSSNLVIRPGTAGGVAFVLSNGTTANGSLSSYCTDVEFRSTGGGSTFGNGVMSINSVNSRVASVSNNAFYDSRSTVIFMRSVAHIFTRSWNVFYTSSAITLLGGQDVSGGATIGPDEDYAVFRCGAGSSSMQILFPQQHQRRHKISGCAVSGGPTGAAIGNTTKTECVVDGVQIWSCNSGINNALTLNVKNCTFGEQVFAGCNNTTNLSTGDGILTATDCTFPSGVIGRTGAGPALPNALVKIVNKNGDPDVQEIYGSHSNTVPTIAKSLVAAEFTRSTSALVMTCNASTAITHEISIPAKAAADLKILLYCTTSAVNLPVSGDVAYDGSTLPSATLSGLGITPITATFSGTAGTFQLLTIDLDAADAPAADGLLTLTLTAQSATAGAQAFWAGVPLMPFISRCRHYGYLFDETSPTRTADITKSASEATASGYDYGTITWGSTSSSAAIDTSCTFQQLYDWHQYQACLNVGSAVALTGAGVAGSPALFAAGNVTISTGKTLNGAGSLTMGANTLTATGYTYTGGTFSQLASTPAFSGGTVSIAAEGTYDYTLSSCGVEFGAAGTAWDLSGATISGTVAFTTSTGALAVTVAVPTGTSYTVEGANITVTAPIVSADISITGMVNTTGANNRLQIINQTAAAASDWQAATVYAAGDVVLRTSGIGSENTAGLYMRCTSGGTSHATTEPTWDTTVGNTTADNSVTWTTYSVLYYDADPAGTSLTDTYIDGEEFLAGETIEVRFAEEDPGVTFKTYSTSVVATADGFSALVNETADDVYATYALSGAAYEATFSPNYVANYIVLDANTDFSGKAAYAYYCYLLTTSSGMYRFWGGLTGIDAGNIRNNVGTISLYFDESAGFVKQTDDVRIFRSDNTRPAIDPTTGGSGIEINWRTPVSVVTTSDQSLNLATAEQAIDNKLTSISSQVSTQSQTTPFHVDLRKILGGAVGGDGSETNPWGPA